MNYAPGVSPREAPRQAGVAHLAAQQVRFNQMQAGWERIHAEALPIPCVRTLTHFQRLYLSFDIKDRASMISVEPYSDTAIHLRAFDAQGREIPERGRIIDMQRQTSVTLNIGRGPETQESNKVVLMGASVSRQHADLTLTLNRVQLGVTVIDHSSNGTYAHIENVRVQPQSPAVSRTPVQDLTALARAAALGNLAMIPSLPENVDLNRLFACEGVFSSYRPETWVSVGEDTYIVRGAEAGRGKITVGPVNSHLREIEIHARTLTQQKPRCQFGHAIFRRVENPDGRVSVRIISETAADKMAGGLKQLVDAFYAQEEVPDAPLPDGEGDYLLPLNLSYDSQNGCLYRDERVYGRVTVVFSATGLIESLGIADDDFNLRALLIEAAVRYNQTYAPEMRRSFVGQPAKLARIDALAAHEPACGVGRSAS